MWSGVTIIITRAVRYVRPYVARAYCSGRARMSTDVRSEPCLRGAFCLSPGRGLFHLSRLDFMSFPVVLLCTY